MMSKEKIKRFVADHKNELIATTAVAGGVLLVILGCKRHSRKTAKANGIFRAKDISVPDGLKVWGTSDLWVEGEYLNAIVNSIPIDDLGELGKQYIKNGLAQPGDIASVVIGVEYNK